MVYLVKKKTLNSVQCDRKIHTYQWHFLRAFLHKLGFCRFWKHLVLHKALENSEGQIILPSSSLALLAIVSVEIRELIAHKCELMGSFEKFACRGSVMIIINRASAYTLVIRLPPSRVFYFNLLKVSIPHVLLFVNENNNNSNNSPNLGLLVVNLLLSKILNTYPLLTKREVKMAGYWPSSFFVQKRTRPISSHLDRTSLVNKGFIIWLYLQIKTTKTKQNRIWNCSARKFFIVGRC